MDVKTITDEGLAVMLLPYEGRIVTKRGPGLYIIEFPHAADAAIFQRDVLDCTDPPVGHSVDLVAQVSSFQRPCQVQFRLAGYYTPVEVDEVMDQTGTRLDLWELRET